MSDLCDHRRADLADGLACILPPHPDHPTGHRYEGSGVPDRHDLSEAAAERSRG